jgi:hypothetical protein
MVESLHATEVCVFTPGRHFNTMPLDFYSMLGSVAFEERHGIFLNKVKKTRSTCRTQPTEAPRILRVLRHHGPDAVAW